MRTAFILLLFIFSTACTAESQNVGENQKTKIENQTKTTPVLIELFTSEGWSSCPPADRALAFIGKEQPASGAEIITLALHVDYWNYLGWRDEFSSPLFSQRQDLYGKKFKLESIYTPQMVVDGEAQFTGSDTNRAIVSAVEAAKKKKGNIEFARDDEKLKIIVKDLPEHADSTVFLAIAEDNLSSKVSRGENRGQKLEHVSVARALNSIGAVEGKKDNADFTLSFQNELAAQKDWKKENLKIIVFVQENESRRILAVGRTKY